MFALSTGFLKDNSDLQAHFSIDIPACLVGEGMLPRLRAMADSNQHVPGSQEGRQGVAGIKYPGGNWGCWAIILAGWLFHERKNRCRPGKTLSQIANSFRLAVGRLCI